MNLKIDANKNSGYQAAIMEVKNMSYKLWENILSDKTRNRRAEVLLTGFGLKSGI